MSILHTTLHYAARIAAETGDSVVIDGDRGVAQLVVDCGSQGEVVVCELPL